MMFTESKVKQKFSDYSLAGKGKAVAYELFNCGFIKKPTLDIVVNYAEKNGLFTFNNIQSQMHDKGSYPTHSRMNNYWDELDPLLAACWKYIEANEREE